MTESGPLAIIIGGSGFIGTRLACRLASASIPFAILDRRPSPRFPDETRLVDVRDGLALENALTTLPSDATILNLAAEHRDDVRPRTLYYDVNVLGARNVCQAAERAGIRRIVFTSSVAVYGFGPIGTDESGRIAPFNDYGRTKAEAEAVYRAWASADQSRSLTIVRPTVVFGEGNRGNVYKLFRQVASGRFLMVGSGRNRKSMAYVENVAAFLEHFLCAPPGEVVCNYVDAPDYSMRELVDLVSGALGRSPGKLPRIPYWVGYLGALAVDGVSALTGRRFSVSAIRVRKFASDTVFASRTISTITGFLPPVGLADAVQRTIRYEFCDDHSKEAVYLTE